ncbi:probable G-protein coupled receptor 25 [Xiphophorus hellerii]|uniref:probable G-protein coupled receptor 25 n=1 Tax=Xiphophorus hellerii TaxID=8084 RepID=UPI0013B37C46|nr:probable G-protein coupled receptor 25 [Xiphophorus hellerii]
MQSTTSPSPLSMGDEDYASDYYYYENETNITENDTYENGCGFSALPGSHIFLPTMYYLIFFTGFWGNIFVIVVVGSKGKRAGRLVDIFVLNLAMADLVFVLTLPLWAISSSQKNGWDFGFPSEFLCKLSSYIISVNRFSNIFFLTCMSIDRYLAIVKMMDSRYLRSSKCIRITCAGLWIISGILGTPSLIYRKVAPSAGGQSCLEDETLVLLIGMNLGMVFLTFIFPVLIIMVCYGTIIMHLNRHCAAAGNARAEARRRHSLKMVLCIIVAFVATWLPYNTFKSIKIIFYLSEGDLRCKAWLHNGFLISCCLAFLNSCVNPAIYFFLDHHFRRRAKFLFESCIGKTKMLQSFNSSASITNPGTSETYATNGGRTQIQMSLQEENKSFVTF